MDLTAFILAFFIGALPTGESIANHQKKSLLEEGSGNTGATNALRVLGLFWGLTVLFLDILKGIVIVLMMRAFYHRPADITLLTSSFGIIGHIFSPSLRGRGGKGGATALGVVCLCCWPLALSEIAVFLLGILLWRVLAQKWIVAVGSLLAVITLVPLAVYFRQSPLAIGVYAFIALFISFAHRANLGRPRRNEENAVRREKGN